MTTKIYNPDGEIVWEAQYGSQQLLLSCPIKEVLIEGNRGSAKSDTALVDYLLGVNKGWGRAYRGVVFRNEYKELGDIIAKSHDLIPLVFPTAKYKQSASDLKWVFEDGEELWFRHGKTEKEYKTYHGQSFPWIFFDELTNFPDLKFYDAMKSCNRSKVVGIKKRILSATNPHGESHTLVKKRFIDPAPPNTIIDDELGVRTRIHASFVENKYIFKNDPDYIKTLLAIQDPVMYEAWVMGNWNIPSGGMFQHLWFYDKHVIDLNEIEIPSHWEITRSMDWGSSSPFAVLWWATSPGELIKWKGGEKYLPKGTKILLSTWYGCEKGKPNTGIMLTNSEIADGIIEHEKDMNYSNVKAGQADSAMWNAVGEERKADGTIKSMYDTYENKGVYFKKCSKGAGSRVTGVGVIANMLKASLDDNMEDKGLFIGSNNIDAIGQLPNMPRDKKNPEDVDSDSEDHIYDAIRYECTADSYEQWRFDA